ncbi:hypothetical protein CAPTEDRAFT_166140 [Capitella teleta]|uniref:C2H2-type domain-containing protein n=1 Tax=Capitella teleta TaxID=283909 RepID=R7USX8_CAPTE|nr:hypothetical protein CAPTEDRAFT_166140 [Capitella teleta]|eukprot:ELU09584.1 hypothetical protein CAPTEDRAFT_166140 [Capitella teleta]
MASPPTDFAPQSYTMMPCYMPDTFAPIQPALPPPLMKADSPVAQNCARIASKGHLMSQVSPRLKVEEGSSSAYLECKWTDCHDKFPALDELVNHINDAHVRAERDAEYKCLWRNCPRKGRGFNARYKMLVHVRTHTNERPHVCCVCGKSFSRQENLKIHNRSHTGEKPYLCPVKGCKKAYSNSSDRFKHVRTHETTKPYFCRFKGCIKRYTDPSSLRKHIKSNRHQVIDDNYSENVCAVNQCEFNSVLIPPNFLSVPVDTVAKVTGQESPLDLTVAPAPSHNGGMLMQ